MNETESSACKKKDPTPEQLESARQREERSRSKNRTD
jgi:hypothetical protein